MSAKAASSRRPRRPARVIEVAPASYPLEQAAELAELSPDLVRSYWKLGLVTASSSGRRQPRFDDTGVYQLRQIRHFRVHYHVNDEALPLVVSLLRDLERLQAELRFFHRR